MTPALKFCETDSKVSTPVSRRVKADSKNLNKHCNAKAQ